MMVSGLFADRTTYRKFLILVGIALLSVVLFSGIGAFLVKELYGFDIREQAGNPGDPAVIPALKLLQLITTGIGLFMVPSLIAAWLFSKSPATYLSLRGSTPAVSYILTLLIMMASVPAINLLLAWNQQLDLPDFLSGIENWIRSSEKSAEQLTRAFLEVETFSGLLYNLFIIAVVTAIGEELLFRGILQRLFTDLTNNPHTAIILTSILFSAIHMQFYGFVPRMLLGVLFGYLLYWSGSLWIPIFAHFINNGAAVMLTWYATGKELPFDHETIGSNQGELPLAILSVIIITLLLFYLRKISFRQKFSVSGES